jgi:hypothetical protein
VIWERTRARLLAGETVLGYFEIAGTDDPLPGSLRWNADSGAMVELLDPKWGSPDVSVGHVTVTRPGSGGHSPPSFSMAREISASGE